MSLIKENIELEFLIEATNQSLLDRPKKESIELNYLNIINWEKATDLAEKHGLLPMVFNFTSQLKIESKIVKRFEKNARENTINNLFTSKAYNYTIDLFIKNQIEVLPCKGHLFLSELYNGKQLREIADLDILVKPEDASKALGILTADNYIFYDVNKETKLTTDELINLIPNVIGMNETTLLKNINGNNAFIDFHWGFHYGFLPYKIDLNWLFENKRTIFINNFPSPCPSNEAMFTMLIIHHAGTDIWMKLKYMADLLAFMETKGKEINWPKMLEKLAEMNLKRPSLVGFFLLKHYFDYQIPKEIESEFDAEKINHKLILPIIDYWENCYNILSLKGRLKYEKILWSIQDVGFSRWKYFKEMFKMYLIPNPIESKRLVTFPDNYYFLNGLSKVVTYLYKRGFGKVIR